MTPTTEELIKILEAVVSPEFEATYCDDVLGMNWFDARNKAVRQLKAELSRREEVKSVKCVCGIKERNDAWICNRVCHGGEK